MTLLHRNCPPGEPHKVTITADNEVDLLKRVNLINSAMFRVLKETQLVRVLEANYERGTVVLLVLVEKLNPLIAPGSVSISVEPLTQA